MAPTSQLTMSFSAEYLSFVGNGVGYGGGVYSGCGRVGGCCVIAVQAMPLSAAHLSTDERSSAPTVISIVLPVAVRAPMIRNFMTAPLHQARRGLLHDPH